VGEARRDAAFGAVGDDGDRLVDGDRAVAAGVEDADLAAGLGLVEGSRERLAGRRAAAGVVVVAGGGDPGAGDLGARRRGGEGGEGEGGEDERKVLLAHGRFSWFADRR